MELLHTHAHTRAQTSMQPEDGEWGRLAGEKEIIMSEREITEGKGGMWSSNDIYMDEMSLWNIIMHN